MQPTAWRKEEDVFFSMRFLLQRPLLKAILSDKPTVLLIDEIDRADAEFEAFLLEILSDFQVSVPELGTLSAKSPAGRAHQQQYARVIRSAQTALPLSLYRLSRNRTGTGCGPPESARTVTKTGT
jgi:hypothetical protein